MSAFSYCLGALGVNDRRQIIYTTQHLLGLSLNVTNTEAPTPGL